MGLLSVNAEYIETGLPYPDEYKLDDVNSPKEKIDQEIKEKIEFIENDIKRLDKLWETY
jgi:hypothetical protein